jgi:hypothetical protein
MQAQIVVEKGNPYSLTLPNIPNINIGEYRLVIDNAQRSLFVADCTSTINGFRVLFSQYPSKSSFPP